MGQVFLLSLSSDVNPTLVAASTLMILLPNPKRLTPGYLLAALMTSITLGLVIVFSLKSSAAVRTTENTLSPAATMALGGIVLVAAFVLGTGRHQRVLVRRRARSREKGHRGGSARWDAVRRGQPSSSGRCSRFPLPPTWPDSAASRLGGLLVITRLIELVA
jgi:hypothetical protein